MSAGSSTLLADLEAEAIQIIREAVAQADRPVLLYSVGKDSAVLLHLVRRAFFPAVAPLPLLHVDTTWKFASMYALRDRMAAESGLDLIVHQNPDALRRGINPIEHGPLHTDLWKTEGLRQALGAHGFDVALGGARRDEERSRAKERIYSFRAAGHRWDATAQRPEPWQLFNGKHRAGEGFRVFPLSNWTELDVWRYIAWRDVVVSDLYFAAMRPTVERDGMIIVRDDDRMPLRPGETVITRSVRFRTLGCYPLTGAVESSAATVADVLAETAAASRSERAGRAIDRDQTASMERKKQEGYF